MRRWRCRRPGALDQHSLGCDLVVAAELFDDNIDTYCLDALNDRSYAAFGTGDGRIYGSADGGLTWLELITGLPPVQHLLLVPD
jgi:hypothetical protein